MTGVRGLDDLSASLGTLPSGVESRLAEAAQRLGAALRDGVAQMLDGDLLQRRSGRLLGALAVSTDDTAGAIVVRVSVDLADVPYAAFQEFGFQGVETVRAHLRQIRQAFGRPIGARQVEVGAHDRRVDYPAHSFLRQALEDMTPDILAMTRKAVDDAVGAP